MTNKQVVAMMNKKLVGVFGVAMCDSKPISLGTLKLARMKDPSNVVIEFSHKSVGLFLPIMLVSTIKSEAKDGYTADVICDALFIGDRELGDVVAGFEEKQPAAAP